jgi:PAS domain S-box-containing protein
MNPMALLYLFCLICAVIVAGIVYNRNPKDTTNRSFSLLCACIFAWIFPQFGFAICRSYEEAVLWTKALAVWPLVYAVAVLSTLRLTERDGLLKSVWIKFGVGAVAVIFAVFELTIGVTFGAPRKYAVGWVAGNGAITVISIAAIIWAMLCLLLSLYLVARYILTAKDDHKRKQLRTFSIAYSIGVIAAFADVARINLGYSYPMISPIALVFAAVFLGYAMRKYKLFSLTPMAAADNIIATMNDMLFLVDTKGTILTANRAAHGTLGYSESELIGQSVNTLFITRVAWLSDFLNNKGETNRNVTDFEVSFVKKDGLTIPASLFGTVVCDANNKAQGLILIGRDITSRKQSEIEKDDLKAMYQQSQKLESIGRLAGGVAHDMNNILGTIMASALVIREETVLGSVAGESVENVLLACYRGRDLTQNLLGFARKGKYVKTDISINQVVTETVAILERTISKNVSVKTSLEENITTFEGDRGQIHSVLMNLCVNAVDAIEGAGEVFVETRRVYLDENACIKLGGIKAGYYIQLKVIDSGIGMDADTLKKAFEPFFTTKPIGKGTGLGLAMAYGVIANHGGAITIESQVGKGTVVTAYFPSTEKTTSSLGCFEDEENNINRGIEPDMNEQIVILLVDDEPLFQSAAKRLIQKMGHRVFVAESGEKAIEIFERKRNQISIVLLDMLMPGLSGTDTFYQLRGINPTVKILIMSGFDKDENVDRLLSEGAIGYLQKPFNSQDLSRELEAVVNG